MIRTNRPERTPLRSADSSARLAVRLRAGSRPSVLADWFGERPLYTERLQIAHLRAERPILVPGEREASNSSGMLLSLALRYDVE